MQAESCETCAGGIGARRAGIAADEVVGMLAGEFEKAADGGGIMPAACVEDERVREARLPCGLEAREDGGALPPVD